MMRLLYWTLLAVQLAALAIAYRDFNGLKKIHGTYGKAWAEVRRNTWRRPVILGTMYSVLAILALPLVTYAFSEGCSQFREKGLHHAGDYALFALPALAGIVAGGGFVWGRDEGEVVNDRNVGYYVASLLILLLSHVIYLKMNFRPFVVAASGLLVSLASIVMLWRRSHPKAGEEAVRKSGSKFSGYELGHALIMIAPPFLLFLLACYLIGFWNWLF